MQRRVSTGADAKAGGLIQLSDRNALGRACKGTEEEIGLVWFSFQPKHSILEMSVGIFVKILAVPPTDMSGSRSRPVRSAHIIIVDAHHAPALFAEDADSAR